MTKKSIPTLDLTGIDSIDLAEQKFLEAIKERIQHVAEMYDEKEVAAEDRALRDMSVQFFNFSMNWIAGELRSRKGPAPHAEATKLKKIAKDELNKLQSLITEFNSCYMHINRFQTLLRDEIRREEGRLGVTGSADMKWNSDMGVILVRYKRERRELMASNDRILQARPVLEQVEKNGAYMLEALTSLYGAERAEAIARSVFSPLRTNEVPRARKVAKGMHDSEKRRFGVDQKAGDALAEKATNAALKIVDAVDNHHEILMGSDQRLYLKVSETSMIYNAQSAELVKIRAYLNKYYMPYMNHKLESLYHLKDKLLVVGSVESLLTLYKKLVAGLVAPLSDARDVRLYESEVIERVQWLMQGHFLEIPKIKAWAEEIVAEYRQHQKDFHETEKDNYSDFDDPLARSSGATA